LDNLYDWHSGGLFERNSPDVKLYAGDEIVLSKPSFENGLMSYSMLKLYLATGDLEYLHAGLTSLDVENSGGLDRGYFHVKAAELILANGLLDKYNVSEVSLKERFWLDDLLEYEAPKEMSLEQTPLLLLVLVALFVGFLSFASPCTLPILPAFIAYTFTDGKRANKGKTLAFFLGLSIVFSLLGMSATAIGGFLKSNVVMFSQFAGGLLVVFGVYILLGKGFGGLKVKITQPTSYLGSFVFGATLGLSWTPCVGPLLVSVLALCRTQGAFLHKAVLNILLLLVQGILPLDTDTHTLLLLHLRPFQRTK